MPPMPLPELLALFDKEQRREVEYPGLRREVTRTVVRLIPLDPALDQGTVVFSKLNAQNADAVISEEILYFVGQNLPFEWKAYGHDAPPDLQDRLVYAGFVAEEPESVMVLDLEEAPARLWDAPMDNVRALRDPAEVQDVLRVKVRVWGEEDAWLGPILEREMRESPDRTQIYVATAKGVPASTAWIRFHPGTHFASLWGGSTVPEERGRGLYTALLAARARAAQERGYRFLTVDASPMSRPILERFDFRLLTTARAFKWRPLPEG